ncbi:MAG: ROK family protein [Paracoccus sp. (in: a-proteobacteria)]|nr:ROK family protein [Paracoccus sp. (in: a-proteobacteria)]
MICGGLDIGGTKIEARLFDADLQPLALRRLPTPRGGFDDFAAAVADQIGWLDAQAGARVPVGIAIPGIVDPATGIATAANLPASGHAIAAELSAHAGRDLAVVNDAMAFALSEANGGAADGADSMAGVILGTGVAAGYCLSGRIPARHGGLAVEIGHVGIPARALSRHDLRPEPCGCGRIGCIETLLSGPGLTRIASARLGRPLTGEDIAAGLNAGDPAARAVFDIWADLAGEVLFTIQMMLDPQVIVIGGGLSRLPGVIAALEPALDRHRLGTAPLPRLTLARHGDSSGARGAAILARQIARA